MPTSTGSETAIEQDTFAAAITEHMDADIKQAETQNQPVKEAPVKEQAKEPVKEVVKEPVKEASVKEEKAELDNPNLQPVEVKEPEPETDKKPEGMTEKGWVSFKAIKAERDAAKQERDAVRTEVEALKKQVAEKAQATKELEDLRKELAATKEQLTGYESEITVTRVEATPKFKKEITAPMGEIKTGAEEIAKRYEVSPDVLMRAIQEPDQAKAVDLMEDVTSDMKQVDRTEMVQMRRDWQRTQKLADELRKNAGQQLEAITREQKLADERASTKTVSDYRAAATEKFKALQERVPILRNVEGKDQWNAHLQAKLRKIESIDVNDLPVEEVADMAAAREALPELQSALTFISKERDDLKTKLAAAEERLAKYKTTDPAAGGGRTGNGSKGRASDYTSFEHSDLGLPA